MVDNDDRGKKTITSSSEDGLEFSILDSHQLDDIPRFNSQHVLWEQLRNTNEISKAEM